MTEQLSKPVCTRLGANIRSNGVRVALCPVLRLSWRRNNHRRGIAKTTEASQVRAEPDGTFVFSI